MGIYSNAILKTDGKMESSGLTLSRHSRNRVGLTSFFFFGGGDDGWKHREREINKYSGFISSKSEGVKMIGSAVKKMISEADPGM